MIWELSLVVYASRGVDRCEYGWVLYVQLWSGCESVVLLTFGSLIRKFVLDDVRGELLHLKNFVNIGAHDSKDKT